MKLCVLLTASVDPKGCCKVSRSNVRVRERDYAVSLKRWIRGTGYPLVFCENSNYDLSRIKKMTGSCLKNRRDVEFLQFDGNDYPRHLGKGYGEGLLIRYALSHSRLLSQCDYVLKITGRTYVKNIGRIDRLLGSGADFFVLHEADIVLRGQPCLPSRLFICRPRFITDYLSAHLDLVNDHEGTYFEHALYCGVQEAVRDGRACSHFAERPQFTGCSGTTGEELSPGPLMVWLRKTVDGAKQAKKRCFGA